MLTFTVFFHFLYKLVGDITFDDSLAIDESIVQSNVSMEESIRPHAQDELVHEDVKDGDVEEEEEELLTSGIVEPADIVVQAPAEDSDDNNLVQFSDEDDDEELLTSGIISPVNEVKLVETEDDIAKQQLLPDFDDDDDEELLTSGIDSGDEGAAADEANRSAENARIISQLVGEAEEDDIGDVDLLADDDDASQDEY